MYFRDRYDAAMQLIPRLEKFKGMHGVILAVPRGGVPVGYHLAKHFDFPLDLMMTKKLGHPLNKEYAIGAVSLEDTLTEDASGIPEAYLVKESRRIRDQLKDNYKSFMGGKEPVDVKGKIVIVTDDGIATGRTMLAAIKLLKRRAPARIIIAVPVSSEDAAKRIKSLVDEFICLHTPDPFYGVGRFYEDFSQVEDEEVVALVKELNERTTVL